MPELPEVETTRRGIAPHVEGRCVAEVVVRRPNLRWPIPDDIARELPGQRIAAVHHRAKYLLLTVPCAAAEIGYWRCRFVRDGTANTQTWFLTVTGNSAQWRRSIGGEQLAWRWWPDDP